MRKLMKPYAEFVLNNTQIGVFICDSKGIILCMNPTFARMFSVDASRAQGKSISHYFSNTKVFEVLRTGSPDKGVSFHYKGTDAYVYRTPIKENDKIVGIMVEVIFQDISDCIVELQKLKKKLEYYKLRLHQLPSSVFSVDDIIGESRTIQSLKDKILKFSRSSQPVLICGESGTGKELVAHSLHSHSLRAGEIFLKINCASIPEALLESELFGYAEGSFTNARKGGKTGKFELADRGSIFLDEIGELPITMQAKLLRVIETKEIEKVGNPLPVHSDFRLIAATNKDLNKAASEKLFRDDLYHRLNILVLNVPPLRDRKEDIALLSQHILDNMEDVPTNEGINCSSKVIELFRSYNWPGNVRELKNSLIFAAISLEDNQYTIEPRHLPPTFLNCSNNQSNILLVKTHSLRQNRELSEKAAILSALVTSGNNKVKASKLLGISRNELYKKLKKYNLKSQASKPPE